MNSSSPTGVPFVPAVGTLRVTDGERAEEPVAGAGAMATPRRSASGRLREHLFVLMHLTGQPSPPLYQELCDIVSQTYWSTAGGITAALRVAAGAVNRHLLRANLDLEPAQRSYGNLICAVLSGDEVYLLEAGSVWASVRHRNWQESLLHGQDGPALGGGAAARIRLSHATAAVGDTMVLTSPALAEGERSEDITRALGGASVEDIVDGLYEARSAGDYVGLVVRFNGWGADTDEPGIIQPVAIPIFNVPAPAPTAHVPAVEPATSPEQGRRWRSEPSDTPGPTLGKRMGDFARPVGALARRAGRVLASVAVALTRAPRALAQRILPGAARGLRRRKRAARPAPPENRTVMIALAIGIPVVVAILVAVAYTQYGTDARFDALIGMAQSEAIRAQAAGGASEEARERWEAVLSLTAQADEMRPEDPAATGLRDQAQAALDQLDGVVRLHPIKLYELGSGTKPRQLVVRGQMILVLDPSDGWVAELTYDQASGSLVGDEAAPVLISTGQELGRETVGALLGLTWVDLAGGRQTSGVVILEAGGAIISYDPASGGEGGGRRLVRTRLGSPPSGVPLSIGSYEGRLYMLDPGGNQLWRYVPSGDTYPENPEAYFAESPPLPFDGAVHMAIDGYIYVLYDDGTVLKFLGGQPEPFEVRGVPGDLSQAVALAVDPSGRGRQIYVADRGNQRVVRLSPDGAFEVQYRADEGFAELESLAIDQTTGRLYLINEGHLYVAPLP